MTPTFPYEAAQNAACLLLGLQWLAGAATAKRSQRSESFARRLAAYWLPLAIVAILLWRGQWFAGTPLGERFAPQAEWPRAFGLALVFAGVAVASWARHLLGRNWSIVVQVKHGHELIERGPYRLVRHPIYTGILMVLLGIAVGIGEWRALVAVGIALASFWIKLRREERFLGEYFGLRYDAYRQRTRALLPGLL